MEFAAVRVGLATSQLIKKWAQHKLPNGKIISGQIINSKTVNYQTLKPEKDGLFCERIFGPIQDGLCACGNAPFRGEKFCATCEVEFTSSKVRRYRLGYIQLVTAAAHVWFFKAQPSFLKLFLNLPNRQIENLLYCTENICRTIFPKKFESLIYQLPTSQGFPPGKPSNYKFINKKKKRFWGWHKIARYVLEPDPDPDSEAFSRACEERRSVELARNWSNFSSSTYMYMFVSGGIRDAALFFGFSVVSKMGSWNINKSWSDFIYFLIHYPRKGDILNKYYPGPPGPQSRLCCLTGAQLIKTWLSQLTEDIRNPEGRLLEIQIRMDLVELDLKQPLFETEFVNKIQLLRRFKYLRSFRHKKMNPAAIMICVLPVLPPDLRPIVPLETHQIAISDLNKLYQNVIWRNTRLSRLIQEVNFDFDCLNSEAFQYAQRLLQESVEDLIENTGQKNNFKSLSDLFKGKKGRFRKNLLGKRVDYSGRSVIVVGPYLKIYECGLPKEIAFELFQPFLIRSLLLQKKAQTIFGAKKILNKKTNFVWNLVKKIVEKHALLLNRAPTLHRLSIQAFIPRIVEGSAILIHPLVCSAFNADFDGDQMGVHIPLCFEARAEAWKIMWSQNNLFSAATGNTVLAPSQDIILGSSFLTTTNIQKYCFSLLNHHNLKSPNRWIYHNPCEIGFETQNKTQKLIEIRINPQAQSLKFRPEFYHHYHASGTEILRYIRTTNERLQFHQNML
uniref:DNA-directed RNA polymerase subunit n=1 Tax=Caulerpa verticillata TaxID=177082 RepID=A0A386B042_9CHLO|nr:RNA polymerase b-subunit [Caulerpa verticillata]AYC65060.1 RNA polymerase b-subunit [Caulerpa verticillata]